MDLRKNRKRIVAVTAALLLPPTLLMTAQTASAAPRTVTIANTLPQWLARTKASTRDAAAHARAGQRLAVRVYLTPKGGQQALLDKVGTVADPSSPDYGHYLSRDQFAAAYEPTADSVLTVQRYLRSSGLKVTGTEEHRRYVSATGTVRQLDKAFHVSLRTLSHDGQQVVAPVSAVSLPTSVASSVLTVGGLDTTEAKMTHRQAPAAVTPPDGILNARPCSTYYGQLQAKYQADYKTPLPKFAGGTVPYVTCGYTGPQLRAAYEHNSGLTGRGVTVAITDAYRWQYIAKDANHYAQEHGDRSYAAGQLSENAPSSYRYQNECDASGWSGEETLDVEAVHAMAPRANIRYYASSSCADDDLQATLARVVDENVATLVTNSWGDSGEQVPADEVVAYNQIVLQGALQGISFLWSSGDNGDEVAATGIKSADFPASLPYATAVGGTATGIGQSGEKLFDAGWGTQRYTLGADAKSWTSTGFQYGAGGGFSTLFNRPSYQDGVVPASSPAGRAVPDIAMDADPNTGMLIGQTQTFPDSVHYGEYRIGGTSLASPLLAGMLALSIEKNGGKPFGQLNPRLYAARGIATDVVEQPDQPGVVRADYVNGIDPADGTGYTLRTFGQDSSLPVRKGWDPVTGIGVPSTGIFNLGTSTAAAAAAATR